MSAETKMEQLRMNHWRGPIVTEAENIKKRWQEHTEELYKKDLHDPDNHDGVITHLEPDIRFLPASESFPMSQLFA